MGWVSVLSSRGREGTVSLAASPAPRAWHHVEMAMGTRNPMDFYPIRVSLGTPIS
jgi:hypothetical protein